MLTFIFPPSLSPSPSPVPLPCCLLAATTAITAITIIIVLASSLIYRIFYNALCLKYYLTWYIDYYYYYYHHHLLLLYYYHYYHYYYCYHRYCRLQPRRYPSLGLASRPPSRRINSGSHRTGPLTGRLLSTMYLRSRVNGSRTSRRWWAPRTPLISGGFWRWS